MRMTIRKWGLSMKNMAVTDSGDYMCVASNRNGNINHTIVVEVKDFLAHKPVFNTHEYPLNQTLTVGQTAIFDCQFVSDMEAVVDWLKMITDDNKTIITNLRYTDLKYEKTSVHELFIHNLTFEDTANYSCVVENYYGISYKNFTLKVISDDPIVEVMRSSDTHWIAIGLIVSTFVVGSFLCCCIVCRRPKNVTISAQKSFIIKKKIILEKPDSDKSNDSIAPLVKIDYQAIEVDSDICRLNGLTSQYELPLDPEWEISRDSDDEEEEEPEQEDEEEENNDCEEDVQKQRHFVFQRNIDNKCYDITELEIRTKYLSDRLNIYRDKEDFV
ncbi:unnamed protein product [Medioppia subpectinata]|uniref:receptor protein-tyrosine kinase n=1 Tax=Medioppia subpectinata TaxID=1979941 RepID=A0A7R9PXV6_9ACAR|nr:unnamed protein product [Medioppia subpectinata]CAG2105204.1 unnamed protein product [Medioppia subpectinata]